MKQNLQVLASRKVNFRIAGLPYPMPTNLVSKQGCFVSLNSINNFLGNRQLLGELALYFYELLSYRS